MSIWGVESTREPDWRPAEPQEAADWLLDYFSRCGDEYRPKGIACVKLLQRTYIDLRAQLYGTGDE